MTESASICSAGTSMAPVQETLVAGMLALTAYLREVRSVSGCENILEFTTSRLKSLIPAKVAGFYIPDDHGGGFSLATRLRPDEAEALNGLVNQAMESGLFGWALRRWRPTLLQSAESQANLMLAPLRTRKQVAGMFAATLNAHSASAWGAGSMVLATHLACAADALLTEKLTAQLQEQNSQLEDLVRQRTHELTRMLEQRQRFMRIAAHDLRNLLTVISGYAAVGLNGERRDLQHNVLDKILLASRQMQVMVDEFLALHLLERQGTGQAEVFELKPLVLQVVDQSVFTARAKNIAIGQELPSGCPKVRANLTHTHQIITNYLSNALKYSPPGTRVIVNVRPVNGSWRVEVQDQGPGVPLALRPQLFVEFAKVGNRPTGGETSTGLGLFIVKTLAEAQGSKVGAEFPPGGGSVFWLEAPAHEPMGI